MPYLAHARGQEMRKLYFLVPGTTGKFACGGLFAELNALALAQQVCAAAVVTYRQREPDTLFLDDVLQGVQLSDVIFVLSWGFDVPKLAEKLRSHHTLYHAHSAGYGFRLPARVPIITVSRNTMGYWGQWAPNALIYYLPNQISDRFYNLGQPRDIDVLVQARKSSQYLLEEQLVPALQQKCNVFVLDSFVDDLSQLFNRAKVYLYDSAEYWAREGVSEGFGLQPMEAAACGCQVFSSVNNGLSDYLDPGFNCYKIAGYSCEFDVQRILASFSGSPLAIAEAALVEYRTENIIQRLEVILKDVNIFFDHQEKSAAHIAPLTAGRILQLRAQKFWQKLRAKLGLRQH